jgi:hypothetical protein
VWRCPIGRGKSWLGLGKGKGERDTCEREKRFPAVHV